MYVWLLYFDNLVARKQSCYVNETGFITLAHLRERFLPVTVTARRFGLSDQTIRNRLRKNNNPIRVRRPCKGKLITTVTDLPG